MNISHLPRSLRSRPEIRALSLPVIPMQDGRIIVGGSQYGYEFRPHNGIPANCTCQAFRSRHICAHYIAQKHHLNKTSESTQKDTPHGI